MNYSEMSLKDLLFERTKQIEEQKKIHDAWEALIEESLLETRAALYEIDSELSLRQAARRFA